MMKRLPLYLFYSFVMSSSISSCDDYEPLGECPCDHGGNIGGWGDADTTSVNYKDTTGGFEVILDDWGERNQQDIKL